jgi:hypothetical protein
MIVIPGLVPGIHRPARSGARVSLDAGDKPRHDRQGYSAAIFRVATPRAFTTTLMASSMRSRA